MRDCKRSRLKQASRGPRNLRKSGSTFSYGTVFAPEQCLYQQEATCIESPKMYSSRRCKNLTYLCGTANGHVSCKSLYGRERKFSEIQDYLLPWYRVCTKEMFVPKEATSMESPKLYSTHRWKNLTYLCRITNDPISTK